jgi:hypothetical protein
VGKQFGAAGRTGSSPGDRSMAVHLGGRRLVVLGCASHRGAWHAGHRGAQPQWPARGGGGRLARGRRRPTDAEAASLWRSE